MASLESLHEKLRVAADQLNHAVDEIRDLKLEPTRQYLRCVGEALTAIIEIQDAIYRMRPELKPEVVPEPDRRLTPDQESLIALLRDDELTAIDEALLARTSDKWRKVARVVGTTMMEVPCRVKGIPDVFYSQRVKKLVKDGLLESQGNLDYMGFSEVRRPGKDET